MSSKNHLILVIIGAIILFWGSYKIAFSKTYHIYTEYKSLQKQTALSKRMPERIKLLVHKERALDSTLVSMNLNGISVENNLLRTITQNSEGSSCKMIDFQKTHRVVKKNVTIETYRFVVQGSFTDILKLLYELEKNASFGHTIHVNFFKEKDLKKRVDYLKCEIFLQALNN